MRAVVIEDCCVAPNGYDTMQLRAGQEICGQLAAFCVENGHAKVKEEAPQVIEPAPKVTKPAAKPKKRG